MCSAPHVPARAMSCRAVPCCGGTVPARPVPCRVDGSRLRPRARLAQYNPLSTIINIVHYSFQRSEFSHHQLLYNRYHRFH